MNEPWQHEFLHDRAYKPTHPFSQIFPPPYRVILLLSLGVLCWAINIHGLRRLGLKPDELLSSSSSPNNPSLPLHANKEHREEDRDITAAESSRSPRRLIPRSGSSREISQISHSSSTPSASSSPPSQAPLEIYVIAFILAAWALSNWLFFRFYVGRNGDPSGRHAQAFQGIAILGVFVAGFWPGNVLFKHRRMQFGKALLALIQPRPLLLRAPTFPAILLADILTSFAKVFGDVWLTACFLVPRKEHHTWWNGRGSWVVPLLVSLPYGIRLLQCLAEYRTNSVGAVQGRHESATSTRSRRPLGNALKYASSFPVIWISASQSSRAGGVPDENQANGLWQLWLLSVFVNSLFSFWWDVTNDWGLQVFKASTWLSNADHTSSAQKSLHRRGLSTWPAPRGDHDSRTAASNGSFSAPSHSRSLSTKFLRPLSTGGMLFPPSVYQVAILADLVLRFTWSLKLSPHVAQLVELESGVFILETLEILRRCGWVFLRVEWEAVKRRRAAEWLRQGPLQHRADESEDDIDEIRMEMDRLS